MHNKNEDFLFHISTGSACVYVLEERSWDCSQYQCKWTTGATDEDEDDPGSYTTKGMYVIQNVIYFV